MKISVIVPTYNEAGCLRQTLCSLQALPGELEVLLIDGGSTDSTVAIAREMGVEVHSTGRGRAVQMNEGAIRARGEVLVFLHADTRLPPDAARLIEQALADPAVAGGCFRLRFEPECWKLRICAYFTRFPVRYFHFGDSAYFVRAEVFRQVEGYGDYPILEDLDLWLRLGRRARLAILDRAAVTSARRFRRQGVIRQQLLGLGILLLYLAGIRPERLERLYRGGREPRLRAWTDRGLYPFTTLWNWARSNLHLAGQTYHVLASMRAFRRRAGALGAGHPWETGLVPGTGQPIWPRNIVYASPRKESWNGLPPETDALIVTRIGSFLGSMVRRSNGPEIPQGPQRRMPHGVNFLHGSIHYNGGFLIFNDFEDGRRHLGDRAFLREIHRFARAERRELTVVLRERSYRPEELAWFVCFVRARLPWYANGNGPTKKRVLWGTPSPYPAVNPINGAWTRDMRALRRGEMEALVRPPIEPGLYFQGPWNGPEPGISFLERFHAWVQHLVIRLKGFQGNLVFTKRKLIEPDNWQKYHETGRDWRSTAPIPHPFAPIDRMQQGLRRVGAARHDRV
jgi:rSAM/selenodomain-associated transferase 2